MQSSDLRIRLVTADSRQFIPTLEDNSIQAVVTDPPYELNFMGHEWDRSGVAFDEQLWKTILDKLTPGAHLIAFAHTTTFDLVCSAIRRARFEIRDMLLWHYGQGFPKGQELGKVIDDLIFLKWLEKHRPEELARLKELEQLARKYKTKDAKERVNQYKRELKEQAGFKFVRRLTGAAKQAENMTGEFGTWTGKNNTTGFQEIIVPLPTTEEGKRWHDYHTHLKPTTEPAILARKPIEKGLTVAENILKWGTGSLNIGACRVTVNPSLDTIGKTTTRKARIQTTVFSGDSCGYDNEQNTMAGVLPSGRFTSNLILSHHPDCKLIREGKQGVKIRPKPRDPSQNRGRYGIYGKGSRSPIEIDYDYDDDFREIWACVPGCPIRMIDDIAGRRRSGGSISGNEPSSKSRDSLIYSMTNRSPFQGYQDRGGVSRFFYCAKASPNERNLGLPEGERNPHVAVKPIELLRYYIRLVTPPGGTILDPFLGSGSTAIAALLEGLNIIGVEIDPNHMRTSRLRLEYWKKNPPNHVKPPVKRAFKQQPDQTNLQNYF